MNVRFKRVSERVAPPTVALEEAIEDEAPRLGKILFALVAAVGADEPTEVELSDSVGFRSLRFDPAQTATASIAQGMLSVNTLDDIDEIWTAVQECFTANGTELDHQLEEHFEESLADLREAAARPVDINKITNQGSASVLANVADRLDEQITIYKKLLATYQKQPKNQATTNELLRVAYNFADGAKALITLVVGISDLKPLVFWLTVKEQWQLADCFGELPFALVGKAKPSVERYRTVISAARNRAFHDIFAFERAFRVGLPGDAFRDAELRLFRGYARRNAPALEYEDRELVELLETFTRASESPLPVGFWERNLAVMEAVAGLGKSLQKGLVLLGELRQSV